MKIGLIKIPISRCVSGIYLRWFFNGWHYFNFINRYELIINTESMGTQVSRVFSVISKVERPTRIKSEYSYRVEVEGIGAGNIAGFMGLLMAEQVMQYEAGVWREVEITRGEHLIRTVGEMGFQLSFEITRKEIPGSSSVFQKSLKLYIGTTLCDLDDDEVIPLNKQTNDIAEMQDRQSDFTAQFRVRKTRAMRALFELSGEVGATTLFPYTTQSCRLISDNIEIITNGILILDKVDEYYYYVSILSGNKNFFSTIESLKLTDLTLASTDHTWDVATMVGTHTADLDYLYPLCEPSDDGGISPISDTGNEVSFYGGWIWPFVKAKAIWDEIFTNAGYICSGNILTNEIFLKSFMPISTLELSNINAAQFYYWIHNNASLNLPLPLNVLPGGSLGNGDDLFKTGIYFCKYTGTYKISVELAVSYLLSSPDVYIRILGVDTQMNLTLTWPFGFITRYTYEIEYDATAGDEISFVVSSTLLSFYTISVNAIKITAIGYGSPVSPKDHLPDLSQTEFIKMICNMFGLIPDTNPRDRTIRFWNYNELYLNIPLSRDWSAYLSEKDYETEFKFGDYAQENYLRYRESNDVVINTGVGSMNIEDTTLPLKSDVVELPVSTCDMVRILTSIDVSRINFNKWDDNSNEYISNNNIDPRIIYAEVVDPVGSPPVTKTMKLRVSTDPASASTDVDDPKKASSKEVSFSFLVTNYSGLSRLLTQTNLRRVQFNLPVYEVAGLRHYVPIYLSQYMAYFYVNKINNYVPGQLCTVDLIKL